MNPYGRLAMRRWQRDRPDAYRQTDNPESFFTWMGEQIAARIATLTPELGGADTPGENDLDTQARMNDATARATELAFKDFGLTVKPELSRWEWQEVTTGDEEALVSWAVRMQQHEEQPADQDWTVEAAASRFLLTEEFLNGLVAAPSPQLFLDDPDNRVEWETSIERRWSRDRMPRID